MVTYIQLFHIIVTIDMTGIFRPSHLHMPGGPKMARAALSRRAIDGLCAVDLRRLCVEPSAFFLSYNDKGALYGNNLVSLYHLSSFILDEIYIYIYIYIY